MEWCPYCNEFDGWGTGMCEGCGYVFPPDEPPPTPEPADRILNVEVFGVGRTQDGETNYFRCIASDERLAALRSMPYADYLETREWWLVRVTALDAACGRCQVCNTDEAVEVHHRTYARRGAEVLEDVTVLCGDCHQRFHDTGELVLGGNPPLARRMQLFVPPHVELPF